MKCKITSKTIEPFMNFGEMPIANGFLNKDDFKNEFFYKMEVGFSEDMSLLQLNEFPKPEKMFNQNYPFFTGSSSFMVNHFKEYAEWVKKEYLNNGSRLIEIGSNDGTFLSNFQNTDIEFVGFEPSSNVAEKANKKNIRTINNFFNSNNISNLSKFIKKTKVICAANVICHIPNLNELISTIDKLLISDGVFIFEEPYLGSMFEKTSYDQIYDEHIYMFSGHSIKKIFNLYNFDLIDLKPQITHGGSMRYIIARKGKYEIKSSVNQILNEEKKLELDNLHSCLKFKKQCELSREKTINQLNDFKKEGKSICGYAATSKSTTILNYCNIGPNIIDYICDTTPEKIGKFSPGMHIPIKSSDYFRKNLPDIAYLFVWNHKKEIFLKEKSFTEKKNGKWFSHVSL